MSWKCPKCDHLNDDVSGICAQCAELRPMNPAVGAPGEPPVVAQKIFCTRCGTPMDAEATACPKCCTVTANYKPPTHTAPIVQSAARWFWWIAGLSLINSIAFHSGTNFSFVIGLSLTQLIDGILRNYQAAAVLLDIGVAGLFVLFGFLTKKGYLAGLLTGCILYALDALVFLFFGDWLSVAFHAYASIFIVKAVMHLWGQRKTD